MVVKWVKLVAFQCGVVRTLLRQTIRPLPYTARTTAIRSAIASADGNTASSSTG
jgi:hypothetical protein